MFNWATRTSWLVPLYAVLMGCPEGTMMEPPIEPGPTDCPAANLPNVPIIGARVDRSVETYIPFDHAASTFGIDYVSTGVARADRVEVAFDFDPLVDVPEQVIEGDCVMGIPSAPFRDAVPEGQEEVVTANVLMSHAFGARAGRVYVSTGTGTIDIRTDTLDAGTPTEGDWFALFEPAHGRGRIMLTPARLDRDTFRLEGFPMGTPGIVALVQLPVGAVRTDAATRVLYVEGGIGQSWRRAARSWYQLLFTTPPTGLVEVSPVVSPTADIRTIHSFGDPVLFADGALQSYRSLREVAPHERVIEVSCDVTRVRLMALNFVRLTLGADDTEVVIEPGASHVFEGGCVGAAASWPLAIQATSLNGRTGALMLYREAP